MRQIRQLTPFRNITTDGIDLRMNIPDRILNALDRSICKHSARNEINFYLNPFINIIDHDELVKKRRSVLSENESIIDIKGKSKNRKERELLSKWIMFFLLITLFGLILFKNSDIEYWEDELIQLFHQSKYFEKSIIQKSDNSRVYQFEPYDEYNLSQAILNITIYSFERIPLENITFLLSSDNRYTIVSSIDTTFALFSSIGVIDNEIEIKENK